MSGLATQAGMRMATSGAALVNDLLWSEELTESIWQKYRASISGASPTPPSDTSNANELVESSATGTHYVRQLFAAVDGENYVSGVYVKANTRTWCYVEQTTNPTRRVYINLTTGAKGSEIGAWTVDDAGDGWWRVSVYGSNINNLTRQVAVGCATGDGVNSYTGDGVSSIYVSGYQMIIGQTALPIGDYVKTEGTAVP